MLASSKEAAERLHIASMTTLFHHRLALLAAGAVLLTGAGASRAASYTYQSSGFWQTGPWSPNYPTLADDVTVLNPGGFDSSLIVAPALPPPTPVGSWTGTAFSQALTINSATAFRTTVIVQSTLVSSSDIMINNRAGGLVDAGTWATFGGVTLGGAESTLRVTNGGSFSSESAYVGRGVGASGTATVDTRGVWNNDASLSVGMDGGSGVLQVASSGTVNLTGHLIVGAGNTSQGTVVLSGVSGTQGVITAYSATKGLGSGTLIFDGGILRAKRNEANFIAGFGAGGVQVTGNNAFIDSNGFDIGASSGFSGSGSLVKQGLGTLTLTGSSSHSGNTFVQSGTLAVSGNGAAINSPSSAMVVGVGAGDNGSLLITSGGLVSNTLSLIGQNGAIGKATVTSGTWATSGDLVVAQTGTGSLLVNGGRVTADRLFVNAASSGTGGVTVSSGTLNVAGALTVGASAPGSLTISGGVVTNGFGYLGSNATGTGTATVSGGSWINNNDLYVGGANGAGKGTLLISGGTVSASGNSILGVAANSSGFASTSTSGGVWNTNGYLIVGYQGSGTLQVNGGVVSSNTAIIVGNSAGSVGFLSTSGSTLFNGTRVGGTIATNQIAEAGGTGTLSFNGGGVRALSNQGDFLTGFEAGDVTIGTRGVTVDTQGYAIGIGTALSGNGTIYKTGSGTLTLSGDNSAFTGAVALEDGVLMVTGDLSNSIEVFVDAQATLGGTGRVGDVHVADQGVISPGSSPGLFTIEGNLTMDADAILHMEFSGTGASQFDQLAVGGIFSASADAILSLDVNYAAQRGDSFQIFTDGLPNLGAFTIETNLGGGLSWDTSQLGTLGILSVVPEPGICLLFGTGAALVLFRQRQRLRRRS